METQNLEEILSEINTNKLSAEDQEKIKEILNKYMPTENLVATQIETEEEWQDPLDFDFLNVEEQQSEQNKNIDPKTEPVIEKIILEIDENGQYQIPFEKNPQLELNLNTESLEITNPVFETKTINESIENTSQSINLVNDNNERIEPIFKVDNISDTNENSIVLDNNNIVLEDKNTKFKQFENIAKNTMGKFHNIFNFKDENGKIDWHNKAAKSVLILNNIKNTALDNKIVNGITSLISKKYKNSKLGIQTNKFADTVVINLMSREERYNKDFKDTISLLGYEVKELIKPTNTPMLTLQDVSNNVNKSLKEKLDLDLTNEGYSSKFISTLSDENKVTFIQKMVWPKLTEMMGESIKLFEALKEIKAKNPICKEISEMAKSNNIEEDLFATMLLKNPEGLKKQGIAGIEKLLEQKTEIENIYFKNEELAGKNFIVIQNLIKASASMQKLIANTNLPTEEKKEVLINMQKTVIKSDNKKKVLFETVQESVSSSLQDNDFVKSLREVNESILKIRTKQIIETNNKPKL